MGIGQKTTLKEISMFCIHIGLKSIYYFLSHNKKIIDYRKKIFTKNNDYSNHLLDIKKTINSIEKNDIIIDTAEINEETKKPTPRIYNLSDTGYDPVVHYSTITELNEKLSQALEKSLEWGDKIPTGIFYKNELITPYTKRITDKIPNYLENPAAKQKISKNGKS